RVSEAARRAGGRAPADRLGGRVAEGEHVRVGAVPRGVAFADGLHRLRDEAAGGGGGGGQPGGRLRRHGRGGAAAGAGGERAAASPGGAADRAQPANGGARGARVTGRLHFRLSTTSPSLLGAALLPFGLRGRVRPWSVRRRGASTWTSGL